MNGCDFLQRKSSVASRFNGLQTLPERKPAWHHHEPGRQYDDAIHCSDRWFGGSVAICGACATLEGFHDRKNHHVG
jgi:hypothetical protein